jgi:cob(I)alamin adenosyltransferase
MKIYTRTGDKGKTSIIGGRVDKEDTRVETYGTVDEVKCIVGQAIAERDPDPDIFTDVQEELVRTQHELFDCGGDLANVSEKWDLKLEKESIDYLDKKIDQYTEEVCELERFILLGGTKPSASIHIARTITRRAERLVVSLIQVLLR